MNLFQAYLGSLESFKLSRKIKRETCLDRKNSEVASKIILKMRVGPATENQMEAIILLSILARSNLLDYVKEKKGCASIKQKKEG